MITLIRKNANIIKTAMILNRGAMAPLSLQSAIIGPKVAFVLSECANRGELFPKANAARITKGVVGNNGKTTPIAPGAGANAPSVNHTARKDLTLAIRLGLCPSPTTCLSQNFWF